MNCEKAEKIHAYHDDALSAEQRSEVEAHLAICAECRELMADLQKLSSAFAAVEFAEMPPRAMSRLYGSWHAAKVEQDRGVRRLAGWLTAAAAAILILVPLHVTSLSQRTNNPNVAVDETVAFLPPSSPREDANSDLVQVAQWMANDLSVDQGR
ncbi:MAG TPA: zf-HC2 domain-containing protein [Tepidisphaeraceae bacterium]|nr:zf-HC2 domain-containing protein [Tepidisphaeraceae bacterium]